MLPWSEGCTKIQRDAGAPRSGEGLWKGPDPDLSSAVHRELLHWQPGRFSGWKLCHRDQQDPGDSYLVLLMNLENLNDKSQQRERSWEQEHHLEMRKETERAKGRKTKGRQKKKER